MTNGVKQGCVLASTLFSMMFSAMLTDVFQDGDNSIPIRYRFDGKLFNLRRLQAKSKVQTEVLDEIIFADDMAKGAPTEEKMQKFVDQVSDSCDSYDLTISIKKTEVVYQPAPGKPYKEPTITVKGQRLQVVDKFTYLGSTLSRVVHIDNEVSATLMRRFYGVMHCCFPSFFCLEKAGGEMINRPLMDRLADASALNAHWMFAVFGMHRCHYSARASVYATQYTLFAMGNQVTSLFYADKKRENTWDGSFCNKTIIKQFYLHQK